MTNKFEFQVQLGAASLAIEMSARIRAAKAP